MLIYSYPEKEKWGELLSRPGNGTDSVESVVTEIVRTVRAGGEKALKEYSLKFDGYYPEELEVTPEEIAAASARLPESLKEAMKVAAANIESFHAAQKMPEVKLETSPGVECWINYFPLERVGLYVPGGTAPLFSTVLMLAIPARVAGCAEKIVCTPPGPDGTIHPAILYAASLSGVDRIFRCGGAQAIAAMAYGAGPVPAVDKIFGPGNRFVTMAKQLVNSSGIPIDMPAGPSEVAVLADEKADPEFLAADLLSQAEHGTDSQVLLVTTEKKLIREVLDALKTQLDLLPRREIAERTLEQSKIFLVSDMEEAMELINRYAPEHLIINTENAFALARRVRNAGSVFIGQYTPESAGDYASGTNHTLPTNGFARSWSGVSLGSFMKSVSYQHISAEGLLKIGPVIESMAEAEGLDAHKNAVGLRTNKISES